MRTADALNADLDIVREARILFGHQSVGADILEGITELTDQLHAAPLRTIAGTGPGAATSASGFLAEVRIGSNGDPLSKFEAFRAAAGGAASRYDVVMMKLCYADFDAASDPARIFDGYRRVVAGVRAEPASPVVLHITTPLQTMTPGWKLLVKKLRRGSEDVRRVENLRRADYNARLRRTFSGEPLFDLAALESGVSVEAPLPTAVDPGAPPALLNQYTHDGGHLNAEGRSVVARGFLRALADAVRASRRRTVA
jgi:hypothetical protein